MKDRKMDLHSRDNSKVQGKFRTAINALHNYKVVEVRHFGTTCEDAYFGRIFQEST
jgi:hypothetical protein